MPDYNSLEYKRSRGAYMAQCTVEYFVSLLVTDAFLAKLLSYVGISDALIGIISSFITLAFVIQLFSIFLVRIKISSKKLVMILDTASVFFFMLLYFVPFISTDKAIRTVLIIFCVLFAYIGKYLVISILFKWGNSFVEPSKRGSFSASKEMISLFLGMIFTSVVGLIIDHFDSLNNLSGAFLFIAIGILILNICNFVCMSMIVKEPSQSLESDRQSLKVIAKHTLGNKNFRNVIWLTVLWDTARYLTVGFLGIYKTKELMMSVFLIQIINISGSFIRMLISKPFGRFSDKHSYTKGFELGMCFAAVAFFINIFTTPSTWFLIIIYTIAMNISTAGTNQNSFNIAYSYVDSRYITQAMAIKNSLGGLFGFGASLLGGKLLSFVQANGNSLFGIHIFGQQLTSIISFVLLVFTIIFTRRVIEKQKIMIQ